MPQSIDAQTSGTPLPPVPWWRRPFLTHRARRSAAVVLGTCILALCVLWGSLASTPPLPLLPLLHDVPFSQEVQDRHGKLLRLGLSADEKYRVFTPLHAVAPEAVQATLLYEDRYFYQHIGVNPFALARSAYAMLRGTRRMGGSTLTMQVARLRYQLTTSTPWGKLVQIYRALQLEYHYSKQDILEAYFNLAPYGANIEGIGAAAQIYFRHSADRLTLSESLALAPVPQNPIKRSPLQGKDFTAARTRMHALWQQQAGTPPSTDTLPPLRMFGPAALPFKAPHVAEYVLQPVVPVSVPLAQHTPQEASTPLPQRRQTFPPQALRTTIDSRLQALLEGHISKFAATGRPFGLNNAAALLVHWPSMEIRALVGSADFHNTAISGQVDGTRARRSPGSTLKPFIYALALEQGLIHPQTLLIDSPHSFGDYTPENFDRAFSGPLPAHQALRSSRNIPAIWLASRLQPDLYSLLRRADVQLTADRQHYGLSLVLGGAEVTMRELAALYAMLPNKGLWQELRLLHSDPRSPARALLSPEVALVTLRMLESPHQSAVAQGKVPLRYKTGTSNRFRDAWTAGIVGPYVLVVWAGNFDNSPNPLLIGGFVAAPLYSDMARSIVVQEQLTDLIPKQQEGLNIIRIPMCADTGDIDTSLCARTTENWYIPGRSPTQSSGVYRTIVLDNVTGLRACPSTGTATARETHEVVWEFWPSDIQELFRQAGISKPAPPPFMPQCRPYSEGVQQTQEQQDSPNAAGQPPRILMPKEGVKYQRSLTASTRSGPSGAIPLRASADADASTIFWFTGSHFVGSTKPDAVLLWHPVSGVHTLRAVDDRGRASLRRVSVEAVP